MPDENEKPYDPIIFTNELPGSKPNETSPDYQAGYREGFTGHQSKENLEQQGLIPISPELKAFAEDVKNIYRDYFSNLGITDVTWPKEAYEQATPLFTHEDVPEAFANSLGHAGGGLVRILSEQIKSAPPELNDYYKARTLAHELYHVCAQRKLFLKETPNQEGNGASLRAQSERQGLMYISRKAKKHRMAAVEEGLATRAELHALETVAKHFPDGAKRHEGFKDLIRQFISAEHANEPDLRITKLSDKPEEYDLEYALGYKNSLALVEYLTNQVPDFIRLAERARILHETVALARAVEQVFGPGSYQKMMLAEEDDAAQTVKDLQRIQEIKEALGG